MTCTLTGKSNVIEWILQRTGTFWTDLLESLRTMTSDRMPVEGDMAAQAPNPEKDRMLRPVEKWAVMERERQGLAQGAKVLAVEAKAGLAAVAAAKEEWPVVVVMAGKFIAYRQ